MIQNYKAIFFDAGGTLLYPHPSVGEIYQRVAAKYGCRATGDEIEAVFHKAWHHTDGMASLASHSSQKIEREWWHRLVLEVFSEIGGIENFEVFFQELHDLFACHETWRLYPGTLKVLEALKGQGKRLVIVSNWDSRLHGLCDGLGLTPFFDFILASAVVGHSKPSPKIFEEALRRSGLKSGDCLHVGDSLEDDIKGAASAGIHSALIDRHGRFSASGALGLEPTYCLQHLRELLDLGTGSGGPGPVSC